MDIQAAKSIVLITWKMSFFMHLNKGINFKSIHSFHCQDGRYVDAVSAYWVHIWLGISKTESSTLTKIVNQFPCICIPPGNTGTETFVRQSMAKLLEQFISDKNDGWDKIHQSFRCKYFLGPFLLAKNIGSKDNILFRYMRMFLLRHCEHLQEKPAQNAVWSITSVQLHTNWHCKNIHDRGLIPFLQVTRAPAI